MNRAPDLAERVDFSRIRYAQVWEDADVLLEGLAVAPGDRCLAIASAGDNALALLTADPSEVVAVDLSRAQLACLALRIAAFRALDHTEVLALVGVHPSRHRASLYARCRSYLDDGVRFFWDRQPHLIAQGIGHAGKFERYFRLFRRVVLPLTQSRGAVRKLLEKGKTADERRAWYDSQWDTRRWRLLFRLFASRTALGRLGRDPRFFDQVEGRVADRIQARVRQAVTATDPSANPYLQWIVTGTYGSALPLYLRPEHFNTIRDRLDRVTLREGALDAILADAGPDAFDRFALSDVFEYMDDAEASRLYSQLVQAGRPGARLAYWNLLVSRRRPEALAHQLHTLSPLAKRLHEQDKVPFYSAFVVEELVP